LPTTSFSKHLHSNQAPSSLSPAFNVTQSSSEFLNQFLISTTLSVSLIIPKFAPATLIISVNFLYQPLFASGGLLRTIKVFQVLNPGFYLLAIVIAVFL
jgi:hypothetical protein